MLHERTPSGVRFVLWRTPRARRCARKSCRWRAPPRRSAGKLAASRFAKALNPPKLAKRFGEEMKAAIRAFDRIDIPDQTLPDDDVLD